MLYFIKSGNYCKVGFSKDRNALLNRMRAYLTHNPSFQVLDIRKGDMETEKEIHELIPPELYHYGEWCFWNKEIARIWLRYYKVEIDGSIEDYFIERNQRAHQAIVKISKNTLYLNFIRYFSKESNLDLSEPDETAWRVH